MIELSVNILGTELLIYSKVIKKIIFFSFLTAKLDEI